MIDFKDTEILDILPFTFKKPREMAMSKTIKQITAIFYAMVCQFDFWVNIDNVSNEKLLDAMAAELDCPFYMTDMPIEQKRSVVKATFEYNSRIGTVGAIQTILKAAFGGGEISEWFEYGGKAYHFRLNIPIDFGGKYVSQEMIENFYKMLVKAKNKRSKLDELTVETAAKLDTEIAAAVVGTRTRITIPAAKDLKEIITDMEMQSGLGLAVKSCRTYIYPAIDENKRYRI